MKARISVANEAQQQILDTMEWWRANRQDAPFMFEDELADCFALLEEQPEIGLLVPRPRMPDLRRVVLLESRRAVYYVFDRNTGTVHVRAVWGGMRGEGPPLR